MAKQLVVNTDELRHGAKKLENVLQELKTTISHLDQSINTLKNSGWKSAASSVYFRSYDGKWKENLNRCVTMISTMQTALNYSAEQYDQLAEDVKTYILNKINW